MFARVMAYQTGQNLGSSLIVARLYACNDDIFFLFLSLLNYALQACRNSRLARAMAPQNPIEMQGVLHATPSRRYQQATGQRKMHLAALPSAGPRAVISAGEGARTQQPLGQYIGNRPAPGGIRAPLARNLPPVGVARRPDSVVNTLPSLHPFRTPLPETGGSPMLTTSPPESQLALISPIRDAILEAGGSGAEGSSPSGGAARPHHVSNLDVP